jgi:protein AbiQ
MQLKKLDLSFYNDHTSLTNALDFENGAWAQNKTRGYGIVLVSINGLTFGIPLRSHIKHDACYIVERATVQGEKGMGLDFSKAVLLLKPSYVSSQNFLVNSSRHNRLKGKSHYITAKFEKYIQRYVHAVNANDTHILQSNSYRFSTLVNYHKELGL